MALLYIDSFDHYQTGDITKKWTSSFPSPTITIGTGRCGTNCMYFPFISSVYKGVVVTGTPNVGFAGFALKVQLMPGGTEFFGVSNAGLGNFHWYAKVSPDGSITVYNGDNTYQANSAPDVIRTQEWYFIEFKWVIDAAAGAIIIHVNEVEVLNVSAINTRYAGYANNNWTAIALNGSNNATSYVDDLYVLDDRNAGTPPNNTFLGDTHVEYLRPISDGTYLQWSLVGAATHWSAVDDNYSPDGDTTYLTTATAAQLDSHHHAALATPADTIWGVQLSALSRKDNSGTGYVKPLIREGGSDYIGAGKSPGTVQYVYLITDYDQSPATATQWTVTEVNTDQYGVEMTRTP